MNPITNYILNGTLLMDKTEAQKLRSISAWYVVVDSKLYKRSYTGPLLRCLVDTEATQVLTEIHEGHCDNHSGG